MKKLILHIISAGLGLWLATLLVPNVVVRTLSDSSFFNIPITANWQLFVLIGILLGMLSYFLRPILSIIAFPIKFITFGFFTLAVNMVLLWLADITFHELTIPWFWSLLWTGAIIWIIDLVASKFLINNRE